MSGAPRESVVLLHGLGRSRASLWPLKSRIARAGFDTFNFPYAPTFHRFDTIVSDLHDYLVKHVKTPRYHLVGHSLGNIIIRARFRFGYPNELGRIVMLAPPNQPPELARSLRGCPPYRLWAGDSGQRLASAAFYESLPVPDVPFGVIAGNKGHGVVFNEPNDGIITVASTRLDGMADHIVLPHAHTFIMNSRRVAAETVHFLQHGRFTLDSENDE